MLDFPHSETDSSLGTGLSDLHFNKQPVDPGAGAPGTSFGKYWSNG